MIKIISDSTCDLSEELLDKYDVDIIPLCVYLGEDEYKDGVNISGREIFAWADENKAIPRTAAVTMEDVTESIKKYKQQNADILMFTISSDFSSTYNVMVAAAKSLDYADHVFVIDSRNLSTGIGLLIVEAGEMIKSGGTDASIIADKIKALVPKVRSSFVVDTLTYLHRGGRCSSTTRLVGSVLDLKPKIVVEDGKMRSDKIYRGRQNKVILRYVKDLEQNIMMSKKDTVFITHSGCDSDVVAAVREYLEGLNYFDNIYETVAGGVVSSHCGPGTLGVLFISE